jgi:glucose/mannose-6-phosphate isomerase
MRDIDSREKIAKIDKENVLGSVEALSQQCLHAWQDASEVSVPESYKDFDNVVMCGMGGSGLGARVIESLFAGSLKVPLVRVNDFHLPKWVNEKTLVFCSSYSGETEETIQNAKEAIEKKAKWMAIGAGNTLIKMAKDANVPFYQINPKFNPSNQPRMAIAYSIVGQLILASKAGLIDFTKDDAEKISKVMLQAQEKINVEVIDGNEAKKLAVRMFAKSVFYVSSGHMVGAAHVINNQLNENGKVFSMDFQIPELNHHLMEGLAHPASNKTSLFAFFVNSPHYSGDIQKRFLLTKEIVEKNYVETFMYQPSVVSELEEVFEFIQFGAYVDLYLSILYKKDPAPIPWVDYFKKRLGQPLGK